MCPSCNTKLINIVYGYMSKDIIEQISNGAVVYGGYQKPVDGADWYCLSCLEDINLN